MEIELTRLTNLKKLIDDDFDGIKARFARQINKDPSYVSRWLSKKDNKETRSIKSATARYIEQQCNKPSGWLDVNHSQYISENKTNYGSNLTTHKQATEGHMSDDIKTTRLQQFKIPLLSWGEAVNWPFNKNTRGNVVRDIIKTDKNLGTNGFALKITQDSYINPHGGGSIPPGATLFIDASKQPQNGNTVVVHIKGNTETSLFKIEIVGVKRYLKPFNTSLPPFQWDDNCKLCGVAVSYSIDL